MQKQQLSLFVFKKFAWLQYTEMSKATGNCAVFPKEYKSSFVLLLVRYVIILTIQSLINVIPLQGASYTVT